MIGDAYVVAGGLMDNDKQDHVTAIVNMALDMLEETAKVESPRSKDTTLQVCVLKITYSRCTLPISVCRYELGFTRDQ